MVSSRPAARQVDDTTARFVFCPVRCILSQQRVLDEKLAQTVARWLADDGAAIDIAHGLVRGQRDRQLERAALFVGDEQRGDSQTTDELLQFQRGIGFARDVDFDERHAEFLQAQARQLLIAAGSFTSEHVKLCHGRDYT